MKKSFLYKAAATLLSAVLLITASFGAVFAEEEMSGEMSAAFVKEIVEHLSIYARYEDVTQQNLYKEGLLGVLEKHPELYETVMETLLESIDEHSEYYNAEDAEKLKVAITGEIVGIGITFQMGPGGVDVRSVIPDTPAAKAGLEVGDIIISADGTSLDGMNSDSAAAYIRGDEGSTVRLGIKRKGTDVFFVDVVREKIIGTSVTNQIFEDGDKKLMYIRVHGFVSNTAECFKKVLDEAADKGIENLIIDLRDNGGGIFSQAIEMADYLVPKGSIITTEDHKIKMLNAVYTASFEDTQKFDTAVLINENSASASEVLAAALSENDSAVLIGTKSYGKGTIQTVVDMLRGDSMKYTVGYYLTPKGNNINGVGLEPDTYVENTFTPFEIEKYPKFRFEKAYEAGDSGDEVSMAKELLTAWGVYSGEIDDKYDEAMETAVYSFQSMTGLYPYGVLDLTTQRELYNRLERSEVEHDDQLDAAFAHFDMKVN